MMFADSYGEIGSHSLPLLPLPNAQATQHKQDEHALVLLSVLVVYAISAGEPQQQLLQQPFRESQNALGKCLLSIMPCPVIRSSANR